MTFANKARSRIRDIMWACEEEEERQDSLRVVKVEEMSRGKGWYICEHHVCAYKSRYMKAEMLLFMQRTNRGHPTTEAEYLYAGRRQRAFRVTTKTRERKKRRVKVSLFERKCRIPCHASHFVGDEQLMCIANVSK